MKTPSLCLLPPGFHLALIFTCCILGLTGHVHAERRVFLSIGNDAYPFSPLSNAVFDAHLFGKTMLELRLESTAGENKTHLENLTAAQFSGALNTFVEQAQGADVAIIFFAGHGVMADNHQCCLGIDSPAAERITSKGKEEFVNQSAVHSKSVTSRQMVETLQATGARASILVLACCRELVMRGGQLPNVGPPFSKIKDQPLSFPDKSLPAVLQIFMTSYGHLAPDGNAGRGSLFTSVLCEELSKPGMTVAGMLGQLAQALSDDRAYPHYESAGGSKGDAALKLVLNPRRDWDSLFANGRYRNDLGMEFVRFPADGFAICVHETRSKDFAAFARSDDYQKLKKKWELGPAEGDAKSIRTVPAATSRPVRDSALGLWNKAVYEGWPVGHGGEEKPLKSGPGCLPAGESTHPVCHVNFHLAKEFCLWLTKVSGKNSEAALPSAVGLTYRLPTDREWSIAAGLEKEAPDPSPLELSNLADSDRSGMAEMFPYAGSFPPFTRAGNYADQASRDALGAHIGGIEGYVDGWPTTSPVMKFPPNSHKLYDMGGNVYEWCSSRLNGRLNEGDAAQGDASELRVIRGGSWVDLERDRLRSTHRNGVHPDDSLPYLGFRVVIDMGGKPSPALDRASR